MTIIVTDSPSLRKIGNDMTPELFKGGCHFIVGGFAAALALYNVMRYVDTQERHSLINAGAYLALFALEFYNTKHHWSQL